jgi:TetR/AcrR family transcriptional repressor of nem operon
MRWSCGQKAQTRRRILLETVRTLREGGVRSVRVAQIMHDVGLTHGGFYAHFPSKEALLNEAVARLCAESNLLPRLQRHAGPPRAALADFLQHYLSISHCERARGACVLPILLPDAGELTPEARATALNVASHLTEQLAELLTKLDRSSPRDEATRLLAETIGLITLARAQPERSERVALLAKARADLAAAYDLTVTRLQDAPAGANPRLGP